MPKKSNTKDFIRKAQTVHGDRYDYSLVDYVGADSKVQVICKAHGVFLTRPADHVRGHGCPNCADHKRLTKEEFVQRASKVHGSKYDYSEVVYSGNKTKVVIVCKHHGPFMQTPNSHLSGRGCNKCSGTIKKTKEDFVLNSNLTHNYKYDYSLVSYSGNKKPVRIICPIHGEFEQIAFNHENGATCPLCSKEEISRIYRRPYEDFLEKASNLHSNKYTYNFKHSVLNRDVVSITCPIHGEFTQKVSNHLSGKGCIECGFETGGFNRERFKSLVEKKGRGLLYVLRLSSESEDFIKIGITTRSLSHRLLDFPYTIEVIHEEVCEDGAFMFDLEVHLHRTFKPERYTPNIEFGGFTECFSTTILDKVLEETTLFKRAFYAKNSFNT